ncbi:MAG: hypothetical protein F6J93_10850 [Oscillatoria sp. SIO1A7]|nr:hypothetical protein [Oscillatoria sp. SIO1A7]
MRNGIFKDRGRSLLRGRSLNNPKSPVFRPVSSDRSISHFGTFLSQSLP